MPFSNREKPRLFDRIRGKSGRDLVNEVKSAFNTDNRRMLFENPSWSNSSFPRGFPFDDEEPLRARRYFPERERGFADPSFQHFHEPPWEEDREIKRRVPDPVDSASPSSRPPPSLNQHGLRNTVPLAKAAETERPPRAMSAPPCDRPQRFTSTCEIPIMGDNMSSQSAPTPQHQQQQQQQPTSNNVRVIPIQVEGRDEPLINSNVDTTTNFGETSTFDARLPRDFGPFRKHSARFQQQSQPQQQQSPPQPQQQPKQKQQAAPNRPATPQKGVDEPDRAAVPPPDPTAVALARIAQVQSEVDELAKQVDNSCVASRSDKQYVYLDEMLTRQLLSLDNVDPAGQDNIRQARRDVIKSIQKCISTLESKVPAESMEVEQTIDGPEGEDKQEQPMDETKTETPAVAGDPGVEQMAVSEASDGAVLESGPPKQPSEDPPS